MPTTKVKEESDVSKCCHPKSWRPGGDGLGGAIYFFGLIGAAVYNVQHVSGFWPIVLAILKAIVWPAFLLHHIFTLLHM